MPSAGGGARLAVDLSPAFADVTPLTPAQMALAPVPRIPAAQGGMQAFSGQMVRPRVVLDPGHGGVDPGAVGAVVEAEVVLEVAQRVRRLLEDAGVEVVMTRTTNRELNRDKATDLSLRAQMAQAPAQLFVSIHANATQPGRAVYGYGIETWWNPNHPLSPRLARTLQDNMIQLTSATSRGLKSGRSLAVLRQARTPAALVEIGFTSHPVDGLNLRSSGYLDRVSLGIARGIREMLVAP
ncbi:N-acetylmuramoyl-L-alanine amidase [Deinococcus lacus]|uniref:N-acetylmuramoyl-L-alanine amidase n=1 Tax=Deinococcus lacus TaxID=392561 RepID=A0ABW1YH61_9DEIO